MRIKKTYRSAVQQGKVLNERSTSQDNTYSCDYLNGKVLYENETGNNGNFSINDNISNYKYIEIFYRNNDQFHSSKKIYEPSGKKIVLDSFYVSDHLVWKTRAIQINGTSLTTLYNCEVSNEDVASHGNQANTYIYRILGYK